MPNKTPKKISSMTMTHPKWAVCYDTFGNPTTWGKIKTMDEMITRVGYSGPIWDSDVWWNKYIKVFDTEEEARKVVDDYKKTVVYDPQ